ncbi:RHS repeat-associated protein [Pseudomonas lini]|uniref:RHS repeat-associated core domain-containing protein n=1 Tax=Pseudomonas lini TaxID=163011 RepID=UPI0027867D9D|nr:RHS repeat-associated core domain-containing protein [Pseudomonas lini]MDQ0126929.1 RHS repeat-associated protein [Pseudomonas lini]
MKPSNCGSCRYHYNALDQLTALEPVGQAPLQRFYRLEHLATELGNRVSRSVFQHGSYLLALHSRQGNDTSTQLLGTDRQRSVLQVSDTAGQMNRVYTPYGHRPAGTVPGDPLAFNGEAIDPATGHYLLGNGHRAFNPVLMRFNSPDRLSPFGRGGLNPYAYCLGDPVNFTDSTGREPDWLPWMVVAMNVVGLLGAGVGLVGAGLAVAGSRTATVPASKSPAKKAMYLGVAGAVTGLVGGIVSVTRATMNATDPDNSAQNPLLYTMAAFSVLSFAFSGASVAYAYRAHRLNRAGARNVAGSGPTPENFPLARLDSAARSPSQSSMPGTPQPSAPAPSRSPMPRIPQQSALNPPLPPIGFENFTNAQSIRRHSI